MDFENLIGNEPIKEYLQKAFQEKCLPQTLLFSGPRGLGKSLFAKALAKKMLKSEHDLRIITPEGKSGLYAIETLREMIGEEHISAGENGKMFILEDAERMQPACANILLKTLEEPTLGTTFVLISHSLNEILPTIVSRCAVLQFQPIPEKEIAKQLEMRGFSRDFAKLSQGSLGRAIELAERPELQEHKNILFQILRKRPSFPDLLKEVVKLEEMITDNVEDPVRSHSHIEHLFAHLLMWHRDQHVRALNGQDQNFLFFPEEPKMAALPLKDIEQKVEQALLAISRNIKLSSALLSCL